MIKRPLFNKSIKELELLFAEKSDDPVFIDILIQELGNRDTPRAKKLLGSAVVAAEQHGSRQPAKKAATHSARPKVPGSPAASSRPMPTPDELHEVSLADGKQFVPGQGNGIDVLAAWSAMEVLSPPAFSRPEDLVGGDEYRLASFNQAALPWENGGERSKKNYRLYYQIVLGTIDMEAAVAALLAVYSDTRVERPLARGEAVIATVMLDREGRLVGDDAALVSSFCWGVPLALNGQLEELRRWPEEEPAILKALSERLSRTDEEGVPLSLTRQTLDRAYEWLLERLALPRGVVKPPRLILRSYQYYKFPDPPETILLNSFFLTDIVGAHALATKGRLTPNLQRYLQLRKPAQRQNLMSDRAALSDALAPARFPLGSWPAPGRSPLALLQQSAVNLALHDLDDEGLLAVNGPPGSGKTTLLRDIIAGIITKRADIMCGYDDPEKAFKNSNLPMKRGPSFVHLYALDEKLRGHEIVVASSNNRAVENVCAELPGIEALAADASTMRYFKSVSDNLLERETWGVIAAVLGNMRKRSDFRQRFWWDEEKGLQRYFRHASGMPQTIIAEAGETPSMRPPHVITDEKPPTDHEDALRRWRSARDAYRKVSAGAKTALASLQEAHELIGAIAADEVTVSDVTAEIEEAEPAVNAAAAAKEAADNLRKDCVSAAGECAQRVLSAAGRRPGFFGRVFGSQAAKDWKQDWTLLTTALDQSKGALSAAETTLSMKTSMHARASGELRKLRSTLAAVTMRLHISKSRLEAIRDRHQGVFICDQFFELGHSERQKSAAWLDKTTARTRHKVFEAAMDLHRAFADAAAKPIRHNLNALMESFGTRSFGSPDRDALIPHVWATLFLVVPVVSTTFASVARMFSRVGPGELGWLLVDEAGQALPQAAVGAIMRTRRAVVVGDPIQIEPVVTLPDKLTEAICARFGVDPMVFNAPAASVQTLADSATAYFGAFETISGTREVGVPLLVHRRCAEPMFSLSNSIAYEGLMVQAKVPRSSAIRDCLGPSSWIDVVGKGHDKWCAREGEQLLDRLRRLRDAGCAPDVYIVTPFVVVQDRLRETIRQSGLLEGWVDSPYAWVRDRVGTVHTVQGREAEAVFFVLGAPEVTQRGARAWAGGKPNLLNVAATRAKEVLYVIGNRSLWRDAGVFRSLDKLLPGSKSSI